MLRRLQVLDTGKRHPGAGETLQDGELPDRLLLLMLEANIKALGLTPRQEHPESWISRERRTAP